MNRRDSILHRLSSLMRWCPFPLDSRIYVYHQTQPLRTRYISLNSLDTEFMHARVWGLVVISFREGGSLWVSSTWLVHKNPGELFSRSQVGEACDLESTMFSSEPINKWRHFFFFFQWEQTKWNYFRDLRKLLISGMAEANSLHLPMLTFSPKENITYFYWQHLKSSHFKYNVNV